MTARDLTGFHKPSLDKHSDPSQLDPVMLSANPHDARTKNRLSAQVNAGAAGTAESPNGMWS